MRVLIAEDDPVSRLLLQRMLTGWDYDVVAVPDGNAALAALQQPDAPKLAVLDWEMPGLDGIEVCRRLRLQETSEPPYLILLTSRDAKTDTVAGLQAGANDYVTKPYNRDELQARLQVGSKVIGLQQQLAQQVRELAAALAQVKQLQGLLPICSYCKKIRDDHNYWQQVEGYLMKHSDVQFSHGICPQCWKERVLPELTRMGVTVDEPCMGHAHVVAN